MKEAPVPLFAVYRRCGSYLPQGYHHYAVAHHRSGPQSARHRPSSCSGYARTLPRRRSARPVAASRMASRGPARAFGSSGIHASADWRRHRAAHIACPSCLPGPRESVNSCKTDLHRANHDRRPAPQRHSAFLCVHDGDNAASQTPRPPLLARGRGQFGCNAHGLVLRASGGGVSA